MKSGTRLQLHAFEPASRANGPGLRAVLWFQGCTLNCPGCFNPAMHDSEGGHETTTEETVQEILSRKDQIEGVSFSGGEPFQQPEALLDIAAHVQAAALTIIIFTGYTLDEVNRLSLGPAILSRTDILIAGRYDHAHHVGSGLLGSGNQQIHFLTSRYTPHDLVPIPNTEVIIHKDGSITITGIQDRLRLSLPTENL